MADTKTETNLFKLAKKYGWDESHSLFQWLDMRLKESVKHRQAQQDLDKFFAQMSVHD